MALPGALPRPPRGERQPYGVVLSMEAGNPFYEIEVLRAPDDGTGSPSTASAESFAVLAGTAEILTDFQPNDRAFRHYLARHVKQGYPNGPDTSWFRASPVVLPGRFSNV